MSNVENQEVEVVEAVELDSAIEDTQESTEAMVKEQLDSLESVLVEDDTDIGEVLASNRNVIVRERNRKASILWGLLNDNAIDPMIIISALNYIVEEIRITPNGLSIKYMDDVPLMSLETGEVDN